MKRLLIALVLLLSACQLEGQSYTANVERVVDGDTLVLVGDEKVRLIGVDTPETKKPGTPVQCYGAEASARLTQLLPKGSQVKVVLDPANGTKPDQYGRTLAYLYADDTFVNLQLIEEGYAKADPYDNTTAHEDEFAKAEDQAKAAHRGLWGACGEK